MAVAVAPFNPHLPATRTSLVGRDVEVAGVKALLCRPDVSLVTLTGPGGSGKTRLALAVAAGLSDEIECVRIVDLAPVRDPAHVPPTVARALDVREMGDQPLAERIAQSVTDTHLLLVLDNLEQVLGAAPFISQLLDILPHLTILATSRSPLRLSGEREFPIHPLALPDEDQGASVNDLLGSPAVRLFVERAEAVQPDFRLTAENGAAVAEICRRLDGLPLAIELAAARIKVLSPNALLARLSHRLRVLTGGPTDAPPRLQTMRDAVAWSYELLAPEEQALFRRLAVFTGGFTMEAAEVACGVRQPADTEFNVTGLPLRPELRLSAASLTAAYEPLPVDVLDGIASLIDKSLLRPMGDGDEPRYAMLETIREYGLEQLAAMDEETAAHLHHAAWCLTLAAGEPSDLGPRTVDPAWLRRLDQEMANLREALRWLIERGEAGPALSLCTHLSQFWFLRGLLREFTGWLTRALALPAVSNAPVGIRAKALTELGIMHHWRGDDQRAEQYASEGLALWQSIGMGSGIGYGHLVLGMIAKSLGDDDRASAALLASIAAMDQEAAEPWIGFARLQLGCLAYGRGDLDSAEAIFNETLSRFRTVNDPWGASQALSYLGLVHGERGAHQRAATHYVDGLTLWDEVGREDGIAEWLARVATLATRAGHATIASRLFGASD
ncbi:MAG: ATP-binding protein, partial [Thermomicrobiales bacterium]